MLQIRLTKPASESGGGSAKPAPTDNVRVACPDHLVLADLPVAKSLGSASASAVIKTVGRRSRRQLGERVHFCVRCDFPIAIYGRLSPCEHAFCLDCARSDSLCYLCDERIQKIQTIKMMEGIFICAAPHCLKSFLKKTEFESHINEIHADLLPLNEKEGNESEATSAGKPSASDSTVQAPLRPAFSSSSNLQAHEHEDKSQRLQSRDLPPLKPSMHPMSLPHFPGKVPNHLSEQQHDSNQSQVFDRAATQIHFPQQTFDPQGSLRQESAATNQNPVLPAPQFGYSPYISDGTQQFFGSPYDTVRPGAMAEAAGSEQSTLLGFPPGPAGPMNFAQNYPQPWNMGMVSGPLEAPLAQGATDGFVNVSDPRGRGFYQGDYGQKASVLPLNLPTSVANKTVERRPQSLPLPPPPLPSPLLSSHLSQLKHGWSYPSDGNRDAPPGFGWQPEGRDSFGGGPD